MSATSQETPTVDLVDQLDKRGFNITSVIQHNEDRITLRLTGSQEQWEALLNPKMPTRQQLALLHDVAKNQTHSQDGKAHGWRGDIGERTVKACIKAGWLEEHRIPCGGEVVTMAYTLTEAGKALLSRKETK